MNTPDQAEESSTRLVSLEQPAALDVARVGAKAAGLAAAYRRGCPVLPGFVVPVDEFADLLARAEALVVDRGVHAAQLEVSLAPLDPSLLGEVKALAAPLGRAYVCRSSSAMEGDATWSGAFSSFIGVSLDELEIAVAGCVASVFRPEVAARLENSSASFAKAAPSVLVQRLLEPTYGGTARCAPEGVIDVVAVKGSPGPLLAGWACGNPARIGAKGDVDGPAVGLVGSGALDQIRAVMATLDAGPNTLIEWAVSGDAVVLLQVGQAAPRPPEPRRRPVRRTLLAPDAVPIATRAAWILSVFAGPLGEQLVLPWRLAPGEVHEAPSRAIADASPHEQLTRASEIAAELNAYSLGGDLGGASELLEALASRTADADLRRLSVLRPVPLDLAEELLALISSVSRALRSRDLLARSTPIFAADPVAVFEALGSGAPDMLVTSGPPLRRWQRLLQLAATCAGERLPVEGVSPGVVSGSARYVPPHSDGADLMLGEILVLDQPLARFAPLLWRAAGVVLLGGNQSAHLLEVARSRRIPAVLALDLSDERRSGLDGSLMLVDGDEGELVVVGARADDPIVSRGN